VTAFGQGLKDAGFVERQNVAIEYRWADNQIDRLPALATDLVRRKVNYLPGASCGGSNDESFGQKRSELSLASRLA